MTEFICGGSCAAAAELGSCGEDLVVGQKQNTAKAVVRD